MIANAGIVIYQSLTDSELCTPSLITPNSLRGTCAVTVDTFDRLMAVNARSTMLCYKYAAKQMIVQGRGGRIIGAELSHLSTSQVLTRRHA